MKKIWLAVAAMAMTASLVVGCGKTPTKTENTTTTGAENPTKEETTTEDKNDSDVASIEDIFNKVWEKYGEEDMFPVSGGDVEHVVDNAAGVFDMSNAEALDNMLAFPADKADMIDSVASAMHSMNANTFTCGIYHVKDSSKVNEVAEAIKSNIDSRQWYCGSPDKLLIATVGDYVVAAFGAEDLMDTFKAKFTETHANAKVVTDAAIVIEF